MKTKLLLLAVCLLGACTQTYKLALPQRLADAPTGSEFVAAARQASVWERDSLAKAQIENGNIPDFMRQFVPLKYKTKDSTGKTLRITLFVLPDYLMLGNNTNFIRCPLMPQTAQTLADELNCVMSTPELCDLIYAHAKIKLEPMPLTKDRDSLITFAQHNQIIEEQRAGRKGLIAGIKKDVVQTRKVLEDKRPNRVAIYGWHRLNGVPIQPVYTGHVNFYVDYSHGIRLIYKYLIVNGKLEPCEKHLDLPHVY